MPTPVKTLNNMTKHLTAAEIEARAEREAVLLPSRTPRKPALIRKDPQAAKHWARILQDMEGLEILDALDTDALAIYCSMLARRDDLQKQYLAQRAIFDEDPNRATLKVMVSLSSEIQKAEAQLLNYANRLGLTPESRARLARKLTEQEDDDPDGDLFA